MRKVFAEKIKNINPVYWKIIGFVLIIKFLIFAFGFIAQQVFSDKLIDDPYWLFGIWNRWDAGHYLDIANEGYTNEIDRRFDIAFFPLYPLLIRILMIVTNNDVFSAFFVSAVATIAVGILFYKLVKLDFSEETAFSSVRFLFIFPTVYFLHIAYTESLFLALIIGSFLAARKEKWLFAGILGFLACTTRINGLILFLALPIEMFLQWRENGKFKIQWFWICLIPLGFIVYLGINFYVTGDALTFLQVQRENFQRSLNYPWIGGWKLVQTIRFQTNANSVMMALQELIFIALGFFSIIAAWKYLRKSYVVWIAANWLLFISQTWILSVPRYTLTLFPMFILFAIAAKNRLAYSFITTWSILFLALFIISFVQERWAF